MAIPTTFLPGGLGTSAGTGVQGHDARVGLDKTPGTSPFLTPAAPAKGESLANVTLPSIAKSVDGLSATQRQESAGVLTAAKSLVQSVQAGRPAEEVATAATNLFQRLQGTTMISSDAHETMTNLATARSTLLNSPAYSQGPVFPQEQSVAEGKIHQSIGLIATAQRLPSA